MGWCASPSSEQFLLVLGGVAIAIGILPLPDAAAIAKRVWPVLLFAVSITVVAELAAEAGVFAALSERTARSARGRAWLLWLFVVVLAVVSTAFLSLDTTAVLLTPVVVLVARHNGLPPLPFALTTVWLANTASLLLPVSNLTNLLALHALGFSDPFRFVGLLIVPAVIAIVVPCVVVVIVFRRDLRLRFEPAAATAPEDPVLFWIAVGVLVVILPLLVTGIPVWVPATAGAAVLGSRVRDPAPHVAAVRAAAVAARAVRGAASSWWSRPRIRSGSPPCSLNWPDPARAPLRCFACH